MLYKKTKNRLRRWHVIQETNPSRNARKIKQTTNYARNDEKIYAFLKKKMQFFFFEDAIFFVEDAMQVRNPGDNETPFFFFPKT
jgi:hypothetical protein